MEKTKQEIEIIGDGIDQDTVDYFGKNGFLALKLMPNGELAGVSPFIFTHGLILGVEYWGYRVRWCYGSRQEAMAALRDWNGCGDPPGLWIKKKPDDKHGPGSPYFDESQGSG